MVRRRGGTAPADFVQISPWYDWPTLIHHSVSLCLLSSDGFKLHLKCSFVHDAQAVCPNCLLMSFEPWSSVLFFPDKGHCKNFSVFQHFALFHIHSYPRTNLQSPAFYYWATAGSDDVFQQNTENTFKDVNQLFSKNLFCWNILTKQLCATDLNVN